MDLTTVLVAIIGAIATVVAAWLSSRPRKATGSTPKPVGRDRLSRVISIIALGVSLTLPLVLWLTLDNSLDERLRMAARLQRQSTSVSMHLLPAESYVQVWSDRTGGPFTEDFSEVVPEGAQGAILKVVVATTGGDSGSFVCADSKGSFNTRLPHYNQISVSNYSDKWAGNLVFCPLTKNRTLKWQMMSNESSETASRKTSSYGALVGWF